MEYDLPRDLKEAEDQQLESILFGLKNTSSFRLSVYLKFEGLKLNPIIFRLFKSLLTSGYLPHIVFSDSGASALAKRDFNIYQEQIHTFKEFTVNEAITDSNAIALMIAPQPYDFDAFNSLVQSCKCKSIMINGRLEDTAVGIGSVGRDRRSSFISSWKTIYSIEPLSRAALIYSPFTSWKLYSLSSDGYRYIDKFDVRPDDEIVQESLSKQ